MEEKPFIIEIDGIHYSVGFRGFDKPMDVRSRSGEKVCFLPWKFRDRMLVLEHYLEPAGKKILLDRNGFAREILKRFNIKDDLFDELAPLALWWAAGWEEKNTPEASNNGWIQVGSVEVRLKAWLHKERVRAISESVATMDDGSYFFNVAHYLETMIKVSVVGINPSDTALEELDAASTAALIDAVVTINIPVGSLKVTKATGIESLQIAQTTLRLCRALGWTPSQVLDTAASEINRLLAMLDLVENNIHSSSGQAHKGLAAHPDAIVIQVEED